MSASKPRSKAELLAETRADLSKLASINQVLVHEVALLKGHGHGEGGLDSSTQRHRHLVMFALVGGNIFTLVGLDL